jgi:protein O-GlcNAcase/histone acetyltransferase
MSANSFLCGVVEGFYGRPWTLEQRRRLFAMMQTWGLNTYLYAPKDDLKHRTLWREPYTESEAADLRTLVSDCQRRDIKFIYALAPGLDPEYFTEDGFAAAKAKAGQLIELGCANFGLLFDDVVGMPTDGALPLDARLAAQQFGFANRFLAFLLGRAQQARLLFCPTPYCARMAGNVTESSYLLQLGERLRPEIDVLWTGPEIVSETISSESIRELRSVTRRKPILWDNLHANDYDLRRIYLGPYSGRPLELRNELTGVLSNPNCEFEANYVPLRTLATWCLAEKYDPRQAYLTALREWQIAWKSAVRQTPIETLAELRFYNPFVGAGTPEVQTPSEILLDSLTLLGDCFYLPYEHGARANELLINFQYLLRTAPSAWDNSVKRFCRAYAGVEILFRTMTGLENRELLHIFYRHVWELKEEMHLLLGYLNWLQSKPGLHDTFTSAEHRPKTYRGGLVAELQRLLPMNDAGAFSHRPSLVPRHDPNPYR